MFTVESASPSPPLVDSSSNRQSAPSVVGGYRDSSFEETPFGEATGALKTSETDSPSKDKTDVSIVGKDRPMGIFGTPRCMPRLSEKTYRSQKISKFGVTSAVARQIVQHCQILDFSFGSKAEPAEVMKIADTLTPENWIALDARIASDLIFGFYKGFDKWEPTRFSPAEWVAWVKTYVLFEVLRKKFFSLNLQIST